MLSYFTTALCSMIFFSCAASEKSSYWSDPVTNHDVFLKELGRLSKHVESAHAEDALKSLGEVLRVWTKDRKLIYPKGYGEARTKISTVFDSYLRNQNKDAAELMMHHLVRYSYFGGPLYSPLKVLQDAKSLPFEKANALWLMNTLPFHDLEPEIILTDKNILRDAFKFIPTDTRTMLLNYASYGAEECSRLRHQGTFSENYYCDQLCHNVELMRNHTEPMDQEFGEFLVQREICMAEDAAEERRQEHLQEKVVQLQAELRAVAEPAQ